jgi:hypothetical protein
VPAAPLPANVVTVATELIGSELLITVLHWAFTFAKGVNDNTTKKHTSTFVEIEKVLFLTCFFSLKENNKFTFFDLSDNCFMFCM